MSLLPIFAISEYGCPGFYNNWSRNRMGCSGKGVLTSSMIDLHVNNTIIEQCRRTKFFSSARKCVVQRTGFVYFRSLPEFIIYYNGLGFEILEIYEQKVRKIYEQESYFSKGS